MTKWTFTWLIAGLMIVALSACQPKSEEYSRERETTDERITLTIRNPKVEISTEFEEMVMAYELEHPNIDIQVHTVGGAVDDLADLKAQIAAGNGPDIFTNTGYDNAKIWSDYLEDLSDQPWIKHAYKDTLKPVTMDGKVYGMPLNIEGYGFIYNKDLFHKVGIHTLPKTLSELQETAKILEESGITPFATGYYEEWKLGDHLLNIAFAQQDNPEAFIAQLNKGTTNIASNQNFLDIISLLDTTLKYGNNNPLTTDYNTEVHLFASGKAAMIQQGNWIQPIIDQQSPNMNIGFLPIPINEEPADAIVVNVSNYWVVNKQSSNEKKKAAKNFLNWMVFSEQGKSFMTEQFKFIPAFDHIETHHLGPLATEIMNYYQTGKILRANWFSFPGSAREEFGLAMQLYVGKQLNRDQLLQEFQKSWDKAAVPSSH
ncbi:ABC transporter substrate-binding protein [Niallia sp. Sow4_A1]|jgi:raffinose/stachyose/melibiose transport system substrate-binding protein|uniref:ABC transporter substrate-binding protein n=1 Tax=Bacillaceae TaxID=186817 RepID=UPI0004E15BAF|nr:MULTISPECIES: ABC transporter substrate-binding protein [Bacillaceae]MCM3362481.1 ABC transporter substrate-binding protein [Niallia sp. MER TA 168]REB75777.1 carbohydrate ABC transporter substrate-binding protein [Cutibacterium acnes]